MTWRLERNLDGADSVGMIVLSLRSRLGRLLAAVIACTAAATVIAPTAEADSVLVRDSGARNLASGHSYLSWARPRTDGRWRLVVASGSGVTVPRIPSFGAAPDPAIGRYRGRVVIAYSRCAGRSALRSCDVWAYDVRNHSERRVTALASRSYSETAPDLDADGRWSFVRRSGRRNGVYAMSGSTPVRRLTSHVARETAVTPYYVAYVDPTPYTSSGCCTIVRATRRTGSPRTLSFGSPLGVTPHALVSVGDRAFWLNTPQQASGTIPLDPRAGGHRDVTTSAAYDLPATTQSIAASGGDVDLYVDAEGIKRVSQPLYSPLSS
jgi:hypothetical protein